ncbi:hypothetical protein ASPWEDRAFT_26261 [Aspergillus wentii DTO 134E9]|uniref:Uncharacterized protein n=1 Tax=Aspergillus wentii DTO 134E9 TaxID=1073089 RepID=A0A1L9RPF1_ASPWE|nr:uncharacterized protein ASPWEDRAFT_26261 [Aspergillus wentii DTO 134E9]OJJ36811.1 hypothetical protein ASPWEDRAFT_26261 [Aspergillus wentii DTO 134E9]
MQKQVFCLSVLCLFLFFSASVIFPSGKRNKRREKILGDEEEGANRARKDYKMTEEPEEKWREKSWRDRKREKRKRERGRERERERGDGQRPGRLKSLNQQDELEREHGNTDTTIPPTRGQWLVFRAGTVLHAALFRAVLELTSQEARERESDESDEIHQECYLP